MTREINSRAQEVVDWLNMPILDVTGVEPKFVRRRPMQKLDFLERKQLNARRAEKEAGDNIFFPAFLTGAMLASEFLPKISSGGHFWLSVGAAITGGITAYFTVNSIEAREDNQVFGLAKQMLFTQRPVSHI